MSEILNTLKQHTIYMKCKILRQNGKKKEAKTCPKLEQQK